MSTSVPRAKLSLVSIAWPIFIEQTLRILIGTVDTFMVSHVSDQAVAALGVANQFVTLALVGFNFIGIGASVVVTHHLGANDRTGAKQIVATAIAVNTWIGVAASLLCSLAAAPLLRFAQLPPELMVYAQPFLVLMGGTLFMEAMNTAIGTCLRAHGHGRDAMVVTVLQNLLNIGFSSVLLFGLFGAPKMGVAGVALASIASRLVATVILSVTLSRRLKLHLAARDFLAPRWDDVRRILHIGVPAAGENLSYWVSLMVITTFASRMGAAHLAAMTYTLNIQRTVILFSISLGLGTEILVGQLIGAGEFEEAHHHVMRAVRIGFMLSTGAIVAVALAGPFIMPWFTHDPAIIATGVFLLRLSILYEPGRVLNIVIINSLRATGDARFPIRVAVISEWFFSVPLSFLFGLTFHWGLTGIWAAMMVEEWVRGLLMARRWRQRRWLTYAERSRQQVTAVRMPTPIES